jgi:hypothetical protein
VNYVVADIMWPPGDNGELHHATSHIHPGVDNIWPEQLASLVRVELGRMGNRPVHVRGYGWISAATARELAAKLLSAAWVAGPG